MARFDELAADQRAVLQLLLRQGKTYGELARILRMSPESVRDRAVVALGLLGPRDGMPVADERRGEIADYLLGQESASQRQSTREYLEASASGRAWARVVADELRSLAGDDLPEVPREGSGAPVAEPDELEDEDAGPDLAEPEPEPAEQEEPERAEPVAPRQPRSRPVAPPVPDLPERDRDRDRDRDREEQEAVAEGEVPGLEGPRRSSRVTGAILIAGVLIIVAAVIVIVSNTGGGNGSASAPSTSTLQTSPPARTQTAPPSAPPVVAQANLLPPTPRQGRLGVARILTAQGQYALEVAATGLDPSSARTAYGVWLAGGPDGNHFLGYPRTAVGRDGRLSFVTGVSSVNPTRYTHLLLTEEPNNGASTRLPTKPGTLVLQGAFRKASGAR